MIIDKGLKQALQKIDFVERYRSISKGHSHFEERMKNYSNEEVLQLITALGHEAKYMKSENFFKVLDVEEPYQFQFNIICKGGMTEFVFGILKDNERLTLGGPWGMVSRLITGNDEGIKLPTFRNYDDLHDILEKAFRIYEDFKTELLKTES